MRVLPCLLFSFFLLSYCQLDKNRKVKLPLQLRTEPRVIDYPTGTWESFLQHLETSDKPILDFNGSKIENQEKHFAILTYDVGTSDPQQCADALMRVRAEYFFSQNKFSTIGFHFNSGHYYAFSDYLKGIRPVLKFGKLSIDSTGTQLRPTHEALRKYLDFVYTYANTVSLCRELKPASRLETGTVIIFPGNPGHCTMIVGSAVLNKTDTVFKLAEGYMPAQSIYILSNPFEPELNPWYHLGKGEINTASCSFRNYFLRKFE